MKTFIKRVILAGVCGAILMLGLGFLNWLHPALDTLSHFRLHLGTGLILICPILLKMKTLRLAVGGMLLGAIGIWFSLSGTALTAATFPVQPGKPVYQMFHFNILWLNPKKQETIDRIKQLDPDLISISEASSTWDSYLGQLNVKWPNIAHCPEFHVRGGVKIFSKWQLDSSDEYCGDYGSFMQTTAIAENGKRIALGSVHPRWPWPASGPVQLEKMLPTLQKLGPDALIAGDFNATTWSWAVNRFAEAGELEIHPGIGGTWMFGSLPTWIVQAIGLPIDNVMSKGKVNVLSVEPLQELGSDHVPLLIRFQID